MAKLIASLVTAECVCVSLNFTALFDVPSLVCADPKYLTSSTSSMHSYVSRSPWLDVVNQNLALVGADLYSVSCRCFLQYFGELLEFFFAAFQKIDIISKP